MRGLLEDGQSLLVGWQIAKDLEGLRLGELASDLSALWCASTFSFASSHKWSFSMPKVVVMIELKRLLEMVPYWLAPCVRNSETMSMP